MIVIAVAELYGGESPSPGNPFVFRLVGKAMWRLLLALVAKPCLSSVGFMTFCPEWLSANSYLDGSNFMYLWVYLVFFNMLWVFFPIYAIRVGAADILDAFTVRAAGQKTKKSK